MAWRLIDGRYQTWDPDAAGLWWSEEIPIGIGIADGAVTIYDREGRGQLREGEFLTSIASARRSRGTAASLGGSGGTIGCYIREEELSKTLF